MAFPVPQLSLFGLAIILPVMIATAEIGPLHSLTQPQSNKFSIQRHKRHALLPGANEVVSDPADGFETENCTKYPQKAIQCVIRALAAHKSETAAALELQQRKTRAAVSLVQAQREENRELLEMMHLERDAMEKAMEGLLVQANTTTNLNLSVSLLEGRVDEAFGALRKVELELLVGSWPHCIRSNDTDEILDFARDSLKKPVLASHLPQLIQRAYTNKTENMDAVLAFIGKLPEKSFRLTAYEALFDSVDHTVDWKDSVRLVYKLHEASKEYNETTSTGGAGSFRGFLASKVRADFVKLMAGEYFNLENVQYRGQNLCTNFGVRSLGGILNAFTKAVSSSERRESKCLWQLIPVPAQDGKMFYLRNKVNASDSVASEINDNHVYIRPVSSIFTFSGATTSDNKVIINMHSVKIRNDKGYPYYTAYTGNDSKYTVNGRETWWQLHNNHAAAQWIVRLCP